MAVDIIGDFRPPYLCMLSDGCRDGGHSVYCVDINAQRYQLLLSKERAARAEQVRQMGIEP